MKRAKRFQDEPGVTEVRRWRAKVWKQGGGTLKGLMKLLRASEAAGRATSRSPGGRRPAPRHRSGRAS